MAAFPGQLPELGTAGLWAVLGVLLGIVGFGTKLWAAWLTGLNTYYCRDMYLGRADATDGFVIRGPYRWLRNPMYGVGNLHGYGVALCYRSAAGLVCVAVFQVLIYAFYLVREKPLIVRTHLGGATAGNASWAPELMGWPRTIYRIELVVPWATWSRQRTNPPVPSSAAIPPAMRRARLR
ncbi:hypothetical protein J2S54_000093 [Streptomyces sp. DSM 42143]|uniref:PEMT/PEM2 family methyltransferase n=1 Tax=Streptomyces sp. DSM 42143 TaxID=2817711 RepID=UPI002785389D|nr:PEMT/PEM2 methyltransferase family protein [Streptomyces sp. DSM 42143]MDQ0383273.1 hypothetical protein [Streptomyces sp. DSM 42143]